MEIKATVGVGRNLESTEISIGNGIQGDFGLLTDSGILASSTKEKQRKTKKFIIPFRAIYNYFQ